MTVSTPSQLPSFGLFVDGRPLGAAARRDLRSIQVDLRIGVPGVATLELANWDDAARCFTWSDAQQIGPGSDLRVSLGYQDATLTPVIDSQVVAVEPTFGSGPPTVVFRAFDVAHRLTHGRTTRTFRELRDSDIAQQVLAGAGITADVTVTKVRHPQVVQLNVNDLDFLRARARLVGHEIVTEGRRIRIGPPRYAAAASARLELGRDLTEFTPRLSLAGAAGAADVSFWDPMKKAAGRGTGKAAGPRMGGTRTGANLLSSAVRTTPRVPVVDAPVAQPQAATEYASGLLAERALSLVEGEAEGPGRADVRPGQVVSIEGAGTVFSGRYYVVGVTHSVAAEGFRTRLAVRRSDVGAASWRDA